jgi:hypothetical protein
MRIDGGTQPRTRIDEQHVRDLAEKFTAGVALPSVSLFYDGVDYWLADGFHRYHAARSVSREELDSVVYDGTRRDAVLFSVGANDDHGLKRSNEDKRKSVTTLLSDDEWVKWSDSEIARRCGVHHSFVGDVRRSLAANTSEPRTYKTKHGTEATMNVENIGKSEPKLEMPDRSRAAVAKRRKDIRDMAERGYTTRQIASALGISEQGCSEIAKKEGITIHADRTVGRSARHKATRIVERMVMDAENLTADVKLIEFGDLDASQLSTWIDSLKKSRQALDAFIRQLQKEQQKHGEAA